MTFCASAPSSLVWAATASNCLRECAVDNSITSENDFTVISSVQKSKAELVLTRVASITLRP